MTLLGDGSHHLFANEQRSATFVCVPVADDDEGRRGLRGLVQDVDGVLARFGLPTYHERAVHHVSVLWAEGDVSSSLGAPGEPSARRDGASEGGAHIDALRALAAEDGADDSDDDGGGGGGGERGEQGGAATFRVRAVRIRLGREEVDIPVG